MPLRFLTAGESHGPELTAILEGLPAGLAIDQAALDRVMARRQQGYGSGGRMKIERDAVRITGGVMAGRTTGAPVAVRIINRDYESWAERDIEPMTIPRPGHADLSATVKYGYRELRLALERASARETAARVAVGALCEQLLGTFGIRVGCYVTAIGHVEAELGSDRSDAAASDEVDPAGGDPVAGEPDEGNPGDRDPIARGSDHAGGDPGASDRIDYRARFERAERSEVRCPDPDAAARMRAAIEDAIRARDTLGGTFEVVAIGVPPGLGSHVHADRRLEGRLLGATGSIPAIKGVEVGRAFALSRQRGTAVHDRFAAEDGRVVRQSNRGGGIEGGISTGAPIVVRAAMKPISTTLTPLPSVDLATGEPAETRYERSDFCAVPRAAVVGEAVVAFVLADALLEKLGGDSMDELRPRFEALRRGQLDELAMDDRPWHFGYGAASDRPDDEVTPEEDTP